MRITQTISETRSALRELRAQGRSIGFVPTMGALHAGHLSLVRAARGQCDAVAVSIFVNPTQFGPNEDFAKYPRTWEADCKLLEGEGVDLLFAPGSMGDVYPAGASTFVEVEGVSDRLDGESRPGHFRGVATVVAKLFHIVAPDKAFFGQKDAAQVAVLRRMVRDLNFDLEMVVCPTVREADGLAMSSRNRYLSPDERRQGLVLSRALRRIEEEVAQGVVESAALIGNALAVFAGEPQVRVDYCRIVDPDSLEDVADIRKGALVTVAAHVGTTRLIDNVLIPPRVMS
jgi:pantoate--beta-alanine ligase